MRFIFTVFMLSIGASIAFAQQPYPGQMSHGQVRVSKPPSDNLPAPTQLPSQLERKYPKVKFPNK